MSCTVTCLRIPRTGWVSPGVLFLALAATTACALYGASAIRGQTAEETRVTNANLPQLKPDGWTPSSTCGECHQSIYAVWRTSLHATAWSNNIFQAAYHRAKDAYGSGATKACLMCHAPSLRRERNDVVSDQEIIEDGISCDFCHSVNAVDLADKADPLRWTVGKTKYGPLRHAQSPVHHIEDSDLHKRSEFCAGCHEYTNPRGVQILSTYSEWQEGPYSRRGQQCQDCHMPVVPGKVVALAIKPERPGGVNLHDVSGSHDLERVREAIQLELSGFDWVGDRVWLFLKVTNKKSGHCFPTGMPMHRAILDVVLREGAKTVAERQISFERVLVDESGRPLTHEYEVMVQAAQVRSDSRLKPGESRLIDVSFRNITDSPLLATATLYYQYSTEALVKDGQEGRTEPVEMKFVVASRQMNIKAPGS